MITETQTQGTPADPARAAQHHLDARYHELTDYCWTNCPTAGPHEAGCYDMRPGIPLAERERVRSEAFEEATVAAERLTIGGFRARDITEYIRALASAHPRERPDPIPNCSECGRAGEMVPDSEGDPEP